jgi:hypothetical protein
MANLPKAKLDLLWSAFVDDAMSPGMAAEKVGVADSTARRYYEMWGDRIKAAIEKQVGPLLEDSLNNLRSSSKQSRKLPRKKSFRAS